MGDYDKEAMLGTFIYEMNQLLEQLENISIQADEGYTMVMINEIFRIMHTIKGSAAMMMYNGMSTTAHAIEDLFFYLRENDPQLEDYTKITDLTLEVADFVKIELEKLENGTQPDGDGTELIERIEEYVTELKGDDNTAGKSANSKGSAPSQSGKGSSAPGGQKMTAYKAHIEFEPDSEMENVRAYGIVHSLEDIAANLSYTPEDIIDEESISYIREHGFNITFNSRAGYDKVSDAILQSVFIKSMDLKEEAVTDDLKFFDIILKFSEGCEMENVRAYGVVHNITDDVESVDHIPENLLDEASMDVIKRDGLRMMIATSKTKEQLKRILDGTIYMESLDIKEITPEAVQSEAPVEEKKAPVKEQVKREVKQPEKVQKEIEHDGEPQEKVAPGAPAAKKAPVQTAISVNVQKLDQLLNLVGELVISEAMVTQNPDLEGLDLESFTKEARQLHKIINDVQDTVMSMRMVPLSPTFFKMHRIVRDMCKNLGKEVNFEVVGEDTEVDKNIIEHISDPLMHIIRNSVDHGIELPKERLNAGKPEKGTVVLEAKNSGGDVLIIVRDNGAGLDRARIMKKAANNGLLVKSEDEYTDKEVYNFILLPGFSTNEAVTEYSGRGVGMDVVTSNIEAVGGTVIVDSTPGEGSTFTLKIPLTLAIIEGMIIKIGGTKYTIPIISIERSFKATEADLVHDPSGNEMITVRDETYNFVRLNQEFALHDGVNNVEDGIVMMLENGEEKICVLVDELIGEQQVVVKSIPKYIKKPRGISGCTLLGNGEISLIIDVAGFFG